MGGNSLTCMLATITPASSNIEETLATLRYACQARSIVNRARINENPHDRLIRELKAEVERLRSLRQDYERNSFTSTSGLLPFEDSAEQERELDDLRHKLSDTEVKLREAEASWEKRLTESRARQMEVLAEAEMYKEELASQLRIMKTKEAPPVSLSPYKTNFLEQLKNVLVEEELPAKKLTQLGVKESMNQIYDIMATFQPHLTAENDQLLFARVNKLLQALETTLHNSINDRTTKVNKAVSFKL